ncbi:hypothetical protein LK434_00275 [Collinsella stercoris DSM 13279]|nr:hypothetical protein LK434_00275 [Collinsella stercoris DSM 13279]
MEKNKPFARKCFISLSHCFRNVYSLKQQMKQPECEFVLGEAPAGREGM